jgi:hypothetical protein
MGRPARARAFACIAPRTGYSSPRQLHSWVRRGRGLPPCLRSVERRVGRVFASTPGYKWVWPLPSGRRQSLRILTLVSAGYLIYLACHIAAAPVGPTPQSAQARSSLTSGFVLGIANPKAYAAFASLLASQTLIERDRPDDALLKWFLCVTVAIVVDLAWLFVGVKLRRAGLRPLTERILNCTLAATIVLAAILTLLSAKR